MKAKNFTIAFAGMHMHFRLPEQIEIAECFDMFIEDNNYYNEIFTIQCIQNPLAKEGNYISTAGIDIYTTKQKTLRIHKMLVEKDGCQVASLLRKDGNNILYYPEAKWDFYKNNWKCLHLLGIEEILIKYNAFLLHSSLVEYQGNTILFCGPSGVGKSTQASLWEKHVKAEILNGDRTVIRKINNTFYGCGSPWAGTSQIYNKKMAPIAGIIVLEQADENTIQPLKLQAIAKLMNQTIVNTWNFNFMNHLTSLIKEIIETVPIYHLRCNLDKEAVFLVKNTLFGKEC